MKKIGLYISAFLLCLFSTSCEDYLDKAPESNLDKEDIFQDFEHAQGFLEQCYAYVVNYASNIEWNAAGFLLGDETLPSKEQYKLDWLWELGSLNNYTWTGYFYKGNVKLTDDLCMNRAGIWNGWSAIRIANIVLETVDDPNWNANITEDEKKLLKGQALFFRAFFHSEIMKFWGRIPYIDKVLTGNNGDYKIPRPATYKECALRADQDYAAAAELLPEDWDDLEGKIDSETIHPTTFGNSRRRINKAIVYSFKGRNLLYAASPLMHCTDAGISPDTYKYDEELAEMAAEALAKVIDMDNRDVLDLNLADKDHLLYCFTSRPGKTSYFPGTPEALETNQCEYIFSSPAQTPWACSYVSQTFMPYGSTNVITPNHTFVYNTFGTENGLSCQEDPEHNYQEQFEHRDPRFYHNLIIDGDEIILKASAAPKYKYAQCYTGGLLRGEGVSKYSGGYFIKKWAVITFNKKLHGNNEVDDQGGYQWWMNMRLTDVYLMYAEALAATSKYGPAGKPDFNGITLSSIDVLNIFRKRFDMPTVQESYAMINVDIENDSKKYMDVLRRERATEMCFEAHRWTDIRRWLIAHTDACRIKTAIQFERDTYDEDKAQRGQFKNINFRETEMITRICEYPKHYWIPFNNNEVQMYEGFPQNPGW